MEPVVSHIPEISKLRPYPESKGEIVLTLLEYEAMRLVDYEGLTCEEAARRMEISRGTLWRFLDSGRKKVVASLVEGKSIKIEKTE